MTGQMGDSARRLLAAFLALALLVAGLPGTNWTAVPTDPDLSAGDYALVQVAHGAAGAVAAKATAAGATDVAALDTLDLVTARLSADALRSLQSDSRVSYLAADAVVEASGRENHFEQGKARPSPGVQVVDADQAWSGATGRGVTVALMDTGIAQHPDLEGSVVARLDFVNDDATLLDPSGHGTFVAGLIAAHGRTFSGVAPDAKLVSLRVLGQNGKGTMHGVLAAFDWLLQNRASMRIKVLNLSFGAPKHPAYHRQRLAGRPRGARRLQPDAGQRRAHREWATDRRHPNPRPRRRRRADRSAGACQRGSSAVAGAAATSGGERECVRSWPYVGGDLLGGHLLGICELGGCGVGERVMGGRDVGQRDVGAALMKGRIDLYVSSVTFAGFIALLAASRAQRTDVLDPIMIAVLVGLACLAQRVPVFLFRLSAISVSFAAVIAAYVLYGTGAAVWVSLAQALVNSVTPRRTPLRKAAFNFGSFALSAFAPGEVYCLTGGMTPPGAIAPTLVSVAISAAAYFLVSTSLTSVAIAMSEGQNVVALWRTNYSWMPVNFGATAGQGAALALAYHALRLFGRFVFTVPLGVAWFSFRLYMAKSTEVRQRNEELSTVNELLRHTNDRLEQSHASLNGPLIAALEAKQS